jgi:hypothetical protein
MNQIILAAALAALTTLPALAGEGLMCSGPDSVEFHLPLAGGTGLYPLAAEIKVGDQVWTSDEKAKGATIITSGQSLAIDDRYYFDFTDPNLEGIVVKIRLFGAVGGDEPAIGGTLAITDVGAWAITCDVG